VKDVTYDKMTNKTKRKGKEQKEKGSEGMEYKKRKPDGRTTQGSRAKAKKLIAGTNIESD
jgi:hypothetical protein